MLGEHARHALDKGMAVVKTNIAFKKLADIHELKDEEERDKQKLLKAKSAPILQFHHAPPVGRVEHLRRFQYTNPVFGTLRQTRLGVEASPSWLHNEELLALKTLGRKTW